MFIAVIPESTAVKAFMFLLDGFGATPCEFLIKTTLSKYVLWII
jgi:hypothetical protein